MINRIDELCAATGQSRDAVLSVERLSLLTGLSEGDVQTLLSGGTVPVPDMDAMVRQRVCFLHKKHTVGGTPRDIREIATAIGQTTTWTKKLVAGEAKPNIVVGAHLAKFYGVPPGFLTDLPLEALQRELARILVDLEAQANPSRALDALGVVHIAGRTQHPGKELNLVELARMVADISSELETVRTTLQRLSNPEEKR